MRYPYMRRRRIEDPAVREQWRIASVPLFVRIIRRDVEDDCVMLRDSKGRNIGGVDTHSFHQLYRRVC